MDGDALSSLNKTTNHMEVKTQTLRKKEQIIAYHGIYKPTTIARLIGCRREYVYIVWKMCGLDPKIDTDD